MAISLWLTVVRIKLIQGGYAFAPKVREELPIFSGHLPVPDSPPLISIQRPRASRLPPAAFSARLWRRQDEPSDQNKFTGAKIISPHYPAIRSPMNLDYWGSFVRCWRFKSHV
jgi:hypothetical protein